MHEDGRQKKRIKHTIHGMSITGEVSWSSEAKLGAWLVEAVRTFDFDGAEHTIGRDIIGSGNDVILA